MVVVTGTHDGSIEEAVLIDDAMLVGQDRNPGLAPCLGCLDNL
jgi:hypothetical protein